MRSKDERLAWSIIPQSIADDSLVYLHRLVSTKGFDSSPVLAEWILGWIADEQRARIETPTERREKHCHAVPPVPKWSDSQLASALQMSCALSYCSGIPDDLSRFVDRIALAINEIAAERLRERPKADIG